MIQRLFLMLVIGLMIACSGSSILSDAPGSVNKFTQWRTGRGPSTIQLIPVAGKDALVRDKKSIIVQVKFDVKDYGEVSFPINPKTPEGVEALRTDLSESKFIRVTYKSNHEFVLQLRQTGVHGGVHNHITLPASSTLTTATIQFDKFTGGKSPLDLSDVAKFNFAFLSNNSDDGFAMLEISALEIDGYQP